MWKKLLRTIQNKARDRSLRRAIVKARESNKKVLVYLVQGQYEAITKQKLKEYWKRGYFAPHLTIQMLESRAYMNSETIKFIDMAQDKKLTTKDIKKLQAETIKKQTKIVKK